MTLIPILIIGVWGTKGQIGEGLYIFTGKMQYLGQKNIEKKCCSILDTKMSGSPIIQNGGVIGAVTHVLVNDPAKGYGIFIEEMLER